MIRILILILLLTWPAAGEDLQAIRCGRLLDVRTGRLLEGQVIVVRGDRIQSVGRQAPASARVIDLSDHTVLPGLIDVHTHLIDDDPANYSLTRPLTTSEAQMAFGSIPNAWATVQAGFTSVRDLGTYRAFVDVALRDAIERGSVIGPRIQPCGAYITVSQGAGALTGLAPDVELPLSLRFGQCDGPDQVRQRVREVIRRGAGVVKILATGAVLTKGSTPGAQDMTFEEMAAAVDEARRSGLKVACHAHGAAGARDAIRAGVASIEHGSLLDEEALRMMKERGVFLSADLYNNEYVLENPPKGYPQEYLDKMRATREAQNRVFQRARQLGVRIAFGSDSATIPHGTNARQFALYVRLGMPPDEAIRTATVTAADLLGWSDRVGAVEPGKLADLIAVRGNPLEDIRLLESPAFVMKGGEVLRNDAGETNR
ncbi:MAG: amidohydrolase family protein [Candidatus Eremiobacterota bacterium]